MKLQALSTDEVDLRLTLDELQFVHQALNEICNGVKIADFEFATRLGWDRAFGRALLEQTGQIFDLINADPSNQPEN